MSAIIQQIFIALLSCRSALMKMSLPSYKIK